MICFRILYLTSLLLFGINISLWGYEKRELLQKEVTLDELKSTLVTEQKWVIYPPYSDRKQWNALLGDYKDHLIRQGEQFLKYNWQVIKASDFLAYERIGSRNRMQGPHNKNNMALSALILAELAEGKGRFLEQIVDGIFFNCEKTTWAVSAHLTAMQKSGRALPELDDPIIDLSSGEIAALMSWAHYFFQKEFDAISPQINVRLEREIHRQIFKPYMNVSRFRWQAIKLTIGHLGVISMSYSVICFGKTIVTNWLKQSIAQYVQSTNSLITLTLMELAKRVPGIGDMQPESSTTISNCSL